MVSGGIRASTPMPRLAEWLESKSGMAPELQATLQCVAAGAAKLARRISTGGLIEPLGSELGENTGGDTQKALDVLADDWFMAALTPSPVRWYASEEQDEVVELNPGGTIALAIDPLDGSSNIDVNVSIGTIFSIFEAKAGADESFLRPGHEQVAAGYVVYGPQTSFVLTSGHGVQIFVLDHQVMAGQLAFDGGLLPGPFHGGVEGNLAAHLGSFGQQLARLGQVDTGHGQAQIQAIDGLEVRLAPQLEVDPVHLARKAFGLESTAHQFDPATEVIHASRHGRGLERNAVELNLAQHEKMTGDLVP